MCVTQEEETILEQQEEIEVIEEATEIVEADQSSEEMSEKTNAETPEQNEMRSESEGDDVSPQVCSTRTFAIVFV